MRECSQLLCSQGMVWDWTGGRCRTCDALSDFRLCSKDDTEGMSLQQRTVTGNLPLLYFPYCKGGGRNLLNIGYGKCKQCYEYSLQTCTGATYPANCTEGWRHSAVQSVCAHDTGSVRRCCGGSLARSRCLEIPALPNFCMQDIEMEDSGQG